MEKHKGHQAKPRLYEAISGTTSFCKNWLNEIATDFNDKLREIEPDIRNVLFGLLRWCRNLVTCENHIQFVKNI